jgi:hypothetical protein
MNGQHDPFATHAKGQRVVKAKAHFPEHQYDHSLNREDLEQPHRRGLYRSCSFAQQDLPMLVLKLTQESYKMTQSVIAEWLSIVQ